MYAHSWGIDRSFLGESIQEASKSIGNSQVLDKDYTYRSELEIVLLEMANQVATRLRRNGAKAQVISLFCGYSMGYLDRNGKRGFHQQMKVPATNSSKEINEYLRQIFDRYYRNQDIRTIGVNTGGLIYTDALQLNLFEDSEKQVDRAKIEHVVDTIRKKFGFKSIVHAVSLLEGGRAIARSTLIEGHAGGMAGIESGESHG
ncbi:DNA polymerase V [Enterococcus sp. AZ163]